MTWFAKPKFSLFWNFDKSNDNLKHLQAQKLASLCGWEPRALPCVDDCKDRSTQLVKDPDVRDSYHMIASSVEQVCNSGQDSANENHAGSRGVIGDSASNGALSTMHRPSDLSVTIVGGPLPTKQNFKATISLPVIGPNLMARISYDSDFRDRICDNQEITRSGSENNNLTSEERESAEQNFREVLHLEKRITPRFLQKGQISLENQLFLKLLGMILRAMFDTESKKHSAIVPVGNGKRSGSNSSEMIISSIDHDGQQIPGADISGSKNVACQIDMRKSQTCSDIQNTIDAQEKGQGATGGVQVPVNSEIVAYSTGKDPKQLALDKTLGFNPIRQRSYSNFCAIHQISDIFLIKIDIIIKPMSGVRQLKSTRVVCEILVDDPIASVRKLFKSPIKRTKPTSGSS
ncbi:hypothetical protein POTOM_041919 [Populus tomentosa]|uniref:Uncharacterized protein n=1 Tax=Populus tomentosa TaxID=118781 RepID=A0A8X7YQL5_POPTO|nr:hypothetical protein POTOM_041919 [Populus tomentosa]